MSNENALRKKLDFLIVMRYIVANEHEFFSIS